MERKRLDRQNYHKYAENIWQEVDPFYATMTYEHFKVPVTPTNFYIRKFNYTPDATMEMYKKIMDPF